MSRTRTIQRAAERTAKKQTQKAKKDKREGFCRSTHLKCNISKSLENELFAIGQEITELSNDTIKTLLAFRGKPYMLDDKEHTDDDVKKEFDLLIKSAKRSAKKVANRDKAAKLAKKFYDEFVNNMSGRAYGCILYDNPQGQKSTQAIDYKYLCDIGLLPIPHSCDDSRLVGLKRVVTFHVQKKLKGFEAVMEKYHEQKERWQDVGCAVANSHPHLTEYESMVSEIEAAYGIEKFKQRSYKRLIQNWLGNDKHNKKNGNNGRDQGKDDSGKGLLEILRETLQKHGPKFRFDEHGSHIRGYPAEIINIIYGHTNLWATEDVVGNKSYVTLFAESYHWQKSFIAISSFGRTVEFTKTSDGSVVGVRRTSAIKMGSNYIHYSIQFGAREGEMTFIIRNLVGDGRDFVIPCLQSKYFQGLRATAKNDADGIYDITYSNHPQRRYWYNSVIKEPSLFWRDDKQCFYINVSMSDTHELTPEEAQSDTYDALAHQNRTKDAAEQVIQLGNYLRRSPRTDGRQRRVELPPKSEFKAIAVDQGINPVAAAGIYRVKTTPRGLNNPRKIPVDLMGSYVYAEELGIERLERVSDAENRVFEEWNMLGMAVETVIKLLGAVYGVKQSPVRENGEKNTPPRYFKYFGKYSTRLDWCKFIVPLVNPDYHRLAQKEKQELLDREFATLTEWVEKIPFDPKHPRESVDSWFSGKKNSDAEFCDFPLKKYIAAVTHEFKRLKSAFVQTDEKSEFAHHNNRVTDIAFKKLSVIDRILSMIRKNIGLARSINETQSVNAKNPNIGKRYLVYREGLRRQVRWGTASTIVSIAVKHGADIIIVEDLSLESKFDKKLRDNKTSSLWSVCGINEALEQLAQKHGIFVLWADPNSTSHIDPSTGSYGYREWNNKHNLWVNRKSGFEPVNCDNAAAGNIAHRGLSRHTDFREFYAIELDGRYYIDPYVGAEDKSKWDSDAGSKKSKKPKSGKKPSVRKLASLYRLTGSTTAVLDPLPDGTMKCSPIRVSKKLREKLAKRQHAEANTFVVLNDGKWTTKTLLNENLRQQYETVTGKTEEVAQEATEKAAKKTSRKSSIKEMEPVH